MVGATVTVEGIVIGNYQGTTKLSGFFLQEEDADADADPNTSEGIFIFRNSCPTAVAEGQRVRATGVVSEFNGMTEITASTAGSVVVTNALATIWRRLRRRSLRCPSRATSMPLRSS